MLNSPISTSRMPITYSCMKLDYSSRTTRTYVSSITYMQSPQSFAKRFTEKTYRIHILARSRRRRVQSLLRQSEIFILLPRPRPSEWSAIENQFPVPSPGDGDEDDDFPRSFSAIFESFVPGWFFLLSLKNKIWCSQNSLEFNHGQNMPCETISA